MTSESLRVRIGGHGVHVVPRGVGGPRALFILACSRARRGFGAEGA